VVRCRDEHQLVGEERRARVAGRQTRWHGPDGEVQVAVVEPVEQAAQRPGAQRELDVRVRAVERGERCRQVERGQRLDRTDPHPPQQASGEPGQLVADGVELGDGPPCTVQDELTGLGQRDAAGGAVQQLGAHLDLQPADLHGDGGLGHPQVLGGPGEPIVPDDRVEVDELAQFHPFILHDDECKHEDVLDV
jgi:hypothetical protein